MKKILITGTGSYVGENVAAWLGKFNDRYSVDSISLREPTWKNFDFSRYDVIFHVAGIAHVSTDPKMEQLYYKVNRDLTFETARKAKAEGVPHFIFMSSIIVYGDRIGDKEVITRDTIPIPSNFYGKSKLQAEEALRTLEDDNFMIAIIRAPMIYGNGSKGNYKKLSRLAKWTPLFPLIENKRSMLYISNLCEFIKIVIDLKDRGTFYPQNSDYVNTSELVREIGEIYGRKIMMTRIFNPIINKLKERNYLFDKLFGDLIYSQELSNYYINYRIVDFTSSLYITEGKNIE